MKRKSIICDMCGREIDKGDSRIKAKMREPDSYVNYDLWESDKWEKLDICTRCFDEMCIYIKTRGGENEES